ncbi:acetyl-CoA carboxylase biotin carboxyl carrier protein [Streptomyces gilvus]|uniref:acetyl-CoA carboxylase biotin carboxyl carrier protein n=1 Tax=Streptomyces gilvus TaxID=2920937 RepID=UPI001F1159FD|nr:biotin/lipoyl-containing protein [Streptomyces sp. CME 23]MCH5670856.1 acetyl-CoA carboxylase biotin carboxyl carrier protein subunit [Streptomyces sp. CME 23]
MTDRAGTTDRTGANGAAATRIMLPDTAQDRDEQRLRLLREEIGKLVRDLPGTLTAVTGRVGEAQLEVAWTTAAAAPSAAPGAPTEPALPAEPQPVTGRAVTAPLVGTFYRAPEPGARPFVEAGDRVVAGQTIGIVEAMKLMNHVASEWDGVVTEILAEDAMAVEYGQVLLRIEPDET